jgi:HTH-type transcriptional regulator/antitoxin HigA
MVSTTTIKPIRTEDDLTAALERVAAIFHAEEGTPEADERDVLAVLIHDYELKHHPIGPPDPVTAVKEVMAERNLSQRDLAPYFGGQSRVSDFLAGKRGLSVRTIRLLHENLRLPLECLVQEPGSPGTD